jgi:hypothetical protein
MAPRLLAKRQAPSSNSLDSEVFRVRAVYSQIGWLETSIAEVAAQTVPASTCFLTRERPSEGAAVTLNTRQSVATIG